MASSGTARRLLQPDTEAIQGLAARIEALEQVVLGHSGTPPQRGPRGAFVGLPGGGNLLYRLAQLQSKLAIITAQNPEIAETLRGLQDIFPLLFRHAKTPMEATNYYTRSAVLDAAARGTARIPVAAKLAVIDAAENDVRATGRELQRVQTMSEGLNPRHFEDLSKSMAQFAAVQQEARDAQADVAALNARLTSLMDAYGAYVDGISEVFVQLDESLREAERRVAQVERKRQNE